MVETRYMWTPFYRKTSPDLKCTQARSQDFLKGGYMDIYACPRMQYYIGGSGGMLPQEIGRSEIASEAILGQKQSRSSYMAHEGLHPIFCCPCMHLLS